MFVIKPIFTIEDRIDGMELLKKIERAGRTCYRSEGKITEDSCFAFVKKIIASGHHCVLEHEKITVRVVCDRGVSHEIVRHRIASYSQESTRYCGYNKEAFGGELMVIEPPFWHVDPELHPENAQKYDVWMSAMEQAEAAYMELISLGASPQEARSVLPNSLKTEIVMTMNLREWRHFFSLRTARAAHPQMREIAIPMLLEFKRLIPVVFDDVSPCLDV